MNTRAEDLLQRAIARLREAGLQVNHVRHRNPRERGDAQMRVRAGEEPVDYAVEIKANFARAMIGAVVTQLRLLAKTLKQPSLLVAEYITPPMADRLKELELQFVDAAGNAYLKGPGYFVWITGRKPDTTMTAARRDRTFTLAGIKILFALICDNALARATYREIARAADVALGAIPPVIAHLQNRGYLEQRGESRELSGSRRLLDDWSAAYARTLRPKQLYRTFVTSSFDEWRTWDLQAEKAKWGGEPAANLLTEFLTPGRLTVYADKPPARLMVAKHWLTARSPDDDRVIELRKPFWNEDTLRYDMRQDTVPAALVYADLLATGEARCIETADVIYEKYLAGRFPGK
jgi:hypothetical protein